MRRALRFLWFALGLPTLGLIGVVSGFYGFYWLCCGLDMAFGPPPLWLKLGMGTWLLYLFLSWAWRKSA